MALLFGVACTSHSGRTAPDEARHDAGNTDAPTTRPDAGTADAGARGWSDAAAPDERDPTGATVADAGFDDDAEEASARAPACEPPEPEPALDVVGPVALEIGAPPPGLGRMFHAAVADDAADAVDIMLATLPDEGPMQWRVARVDSAGALGRTIHLDDYPSDADAFGGAARAHDGGLLVAWRGGRVSRGLGTDAYTAWLGGAARLDGPAMHRAAQSEGIADSSPLVVGEVEIVVSTTDEGVIASEIGRPGRLVVPSDALAASPSRAVALDDTRFAVAWSERLGTHASRARVALVGLDGAAVTRSLHGPGDHSARDVALATLEGEVWIARFERLPESLDRSYVRVSRLDTHLQRIDPDRWLDGWGGTAPGNLELVVFEARVWLVWVTVDSRYGRHVVHASPVPARACGRAVGAAAVELPEGLLGTTDLVAGASRRRLWVAVGSGIPTNEAFVYVLTPRG